MKKTPYIEDNILYLAKPLKIGSEEINFLKFGELTAEEIGEAPISPNKLKEYYPLVSMLTAQPPSVIKKLGRADILKAVEHANFLFETSL